MKFQLVYGLLVLTFLAILNVCALVSNSTLSTVTPGVEKTETLVMAQSTLSAEDVD